MIFAYTVCNLNCSFKHNASRKWIRIFLAVIGSILFLDGLFLAFLNKIHVGTLVPLVLGAFFCLYALFYYHLERFFFYHYRLHTLWRFGWLCFWIWLIGLGYFFNFIKENKDASQNLPAVKAIIVLGKWCRKWTAFSYSCKAS